jgi:glycosyltransferase involved in cell wall biosynthesis
MLHCHGYKGNVIGFFATLFTKTKRITTVHGWTQVDFKVMMYELIDKIVIRYYDKLIAVSEDIKKQLLSYAVPRNKIFVVHNGIDVARFSPRKKGKLKREFKISARYKIIGTIGKLSKEKGHKYFLKAATEIKKKYSNVKFVIVGEGALKRKLKTLAKKVKIENSVIFVGFREDIPEILDDFDIFVLSSVREGIPLVLLEALAKAKPVVSFEVGGIPEVITNGETGILVQARNYKSLAENVVSLLNKPQLAKKIAKKGQERVKKDFNLEAMTDKYQEIYQQIINRKS